MTTLQRRPGVAASPSGAEESLARLGELRATRPLVVRRARTAKEPSNWSIQLGRIAIVVGIFAFWELGARVGLIDTFFWSSPSAIWRTAVIAFQSGDMIDNTLFTFSSTLAGFAIGVVGGVAIGLSFWWSRRYALLAEPLVVAFEAMPKLALAPIVVLVLGLGMSSKIAMATALVIVIQILNTYSAVRSVDGDLTTLMYSLGASKWQVFVKVVVPSVLPWVVSSLRVAIGLSLTGAVVGEYIGSNAGLGRMIHYAGSTFDIALIWVGVFTLAALSMLLYIVVSWFEKRMLRGLSHA